MIALKKIWALLTRTHRRHARYLLALTLIGATFESIGLGMIFPLIGLMTAPETFMKYPAIQPILSTLGNPDSESLFFIFLGLFAALYLLVLLYRLWLSWIQVAFLNRLKTDTSVRLFDIYLHQPWTFYLARHSSSLIQNIVKEIDLLTQYGYAGILNLFRDATLIAFVGLVLIFIEPFVAVIAIALLVPLGWLFQRLSKWRVKRWAKTRQDEESTRLKCVQEGLSIVKELSLLAREDLFLSRFKQHSEALARIDRLQSFMRHLTRPIFEFYAIIILVVSIGVMSFTGIVLNAMAPILGVFGAAVVRLLPAINQMLMSIHGIRYINPVINTIHHEYCNLSRREDKIAAPLLPFHATIELNQISYAYAGSSKSVLDKVEVTIPFGSFTAFIGSTGAGKSTLIDIILGLLTPTSGRVMVDGVDIQTNLKGWQRQIGYVSQNIVLIDSSLRQNVALGVPEHEINDEAIWRALEAAQLRNMVGELPEQLDTIIGERGARLSAGERQRIGIARALYVDRSILVLDEATSLLDEANQASMMAVIEDLKGDKTIIMITHRLGTIRNCDQVFRIDNGRLAEVHLQKTA